MNEQILKARIDSYQAALETQKLCTESMQAAKRLAEQAIVEFQVANKIEEFDKVVLFDDEGNEEYSLKKIQATKLTFDYEKLKANIDKLTLKRFVTKKFIVEDTEGFIQMLQKLGCSPKVFKRFCKVEASIDVKKLDDCFERGKLGHEQIEGCYELKKSEPYFSIRKHSEP